MASPGGCRFESRQPDLMRSLLIRPRIDEHGPRFREMCVRLFPVNRRWQRDRGCWRASFPRPLESDPQPSSSLANLTVCGYVLGSFFNMKAAIHPDYQQTDIVCARGAVY